MKKLALGSLLFAVLLSTPVYAKSWLVDYQNSHLGFVGKESDKSFEGVFKNFQTTIDFDPDKPENGKIAATIEIGSATAGSAQRDGYLPQSDWFDTKQFPEAQFVSSSIKKTGDHAYLATGLLTIKGVSKIVSLPFTLTEEGDHFRAKGKVSLIRTDFHIGDHDWANEDYVKYAVDVVIDLAAKPQP